MTNASKIVLAVVGSAGALVGIGAKVDRAIETTALKADKTELVNLDHRFVLESLRNVEFHQQMMDKLNQINETTTRTYNCLADLLQAGRAGTKFCR